MANPSCRLRLVHLHLMKTRRRNSARLAEPDIFDRVRLPPELDAHFRRTNPCRRHWNKRELRSAERTIPKGTARDARSRREDSLPYRRSTFCSFASSISGRLDLTCGVSSTARARASRRLPTHRAVAAPRQNGSRLGCGRREAPTSPLVWCPDASLCFPRRRCLVST